MNFFLFVLSILILIPVAGIICLKVLTRRLNHGDALVRTDEESGSREDHPRRSDSDRHFKTLGNRALIIEDDTSMSTVITKMLESKGFFVTSVELGEEGIEKAKKYDYNIILLDLTLPDVSGYEVLEKIRSNDSNTPVIIVTGTDDNTSKGLKLGADDYLLKPLDTKDFLARVLSQVRRSFDLHESTVKIGDLDIDLDSRRVIVFGQEIRMSAHEFSFLELLALRHQSETTIQMMTRHLFEDHRSRQMTDAAIAVMDSVNERFKFVSTSTPLLELNGDIVVFLSNKSSSIT